MHIDNIDSFRAIASAMAGAFIRNTREDGSVFYKLRDDAPEWMRDAVRAAHDAVDEMPDDAVYECCQDAAETLAYADCRYVEDAAHEFADDQVSPYNAARVAWLAEKPLIRGPLCDEAAEEYGQSHDLFDRIGYGWYEWARRIFYAVAEGINDEAEAEAEADD